MKTIKYFIPVVLFLFTFVVNANESCIKVDTLGSTQNKNIIFILGFLSDSSVWAPIANSLSKNNKVYLMNISGFGQTPSCDRYGEIYTAAKSDIIDFIKSNNLTNTIVIGHSMGGLMALDIGLDNELKLAGVLSVDGLPFFGPVLTETNSTQATSLVYLAKRLRALLDSASHVELELLTLLLKNELTDNKDKLSQLGLMARKSDPKTAGSGIYSVLTTDLRPKLSTLEVPYLLLGATGAWKTEDAKNKMAGIYNEEIENTQLGDVEMNTQGKHFLMWDQPQWLLNQINNFIASLN
ncbi:alpha/beta hydrolase [Parashewanella spongiae]|uniref:Alpha/beta hydrolase n=1 Tax=Parashewanella spongiae TaxID=342950 RepID=A0A3A6TIX5_9GAMM|nr:alpha/beta hydrolase [Parashewanella spongiae]MCL1078380.1 alpha/beta hydrolase [Parashewanella spongiae]RJY07086.1 alpha/beta hydrolase [Parashewanella spongiae]